MPIDYVSVIRASGLTIYDPIEIGHPQLWVPTPELEQILQQALVSKSYDGLAIKTRSKVAKQQVCQALGYPLPKSFKRTKPRFIGQQFDTYVQQANNLQVWNEGLSPSRRYVLIRPDQNSIVRRVKVVNGEELAHLDTTGTLTRKYQAQIVPGQLIAELISAVDTQALKVSTSPGNGRAFDARPSDNPQNGSLLPIAELFDFLRPLIGQRFRDAGRIQERNRGGELHRLVTERLKYLHHSDDGQFPDVRHQLLEVKLQTSPTIDLGVVLPNSDAPLDVAKVGACQPRAKDVRYAIFYANLAGGQVELTHLYLTTGEDFFTRFRQFQGKVLNEKIQMHLPSDFFDT